MSFGVWNLLRRSWWIHPCGHVIAAELRVAFDYQILGIPFIVAGAFLLPCLSGVVSTPKFDFFSFLTGGLGVLFYGLTGAEILSAEWNYFSE